MKTVLIAGIASTASPGHPYPDLVRTSLETWDSVNIPGMDTFFYFNREWTGSMPKCIRVDWDGALNSMGHRDLLAYRYALTKPWDYMARINASCYVRKQKLMDFVQTLPSEKLFMGVGAPMNGGTFTYLWGGGHYIMSRDVVQAFVDHQAKWDHNVMEDVAMSLLAPQLGIPINNNGQACAINKQPKGWLCIWYANGQQGGFECDDFSGMKEAKHFIRVKQDLKRHLDMEIMRGLFKAGI